MTAREKLLRKRPRRIEIDGDEFTIRALTIAETIRVDALNTAGDAQGAMNFILACALLNDDGTQMFESETDPGISEIQMDIVPELSQKIAALSNARKVTSLEKNSEATP